MPENYSKDIVDKLDWYKTWLILRREQFHQEGEYAPQLWVPKLLKKSFGKQINQIAWLTSEYLN